MNTPTVSVLMPVYNAERYVAEAVESVLAQTFTDFEFIIIDDGSTDGSLAILQKYAARDPRIRLISRPNTGYVVALNEMLGLARGEFLARMDADDVCLPERFERQITYLKGDPDIVALGTVVLLIDSDGDPLGLFQQLLGHEAIDQAHLGGLGGAIAHPSLMVRREALVRVGGYRVEFLPAEDLDLFLRLAECGRLANLAEPLLKYRRHHSAIGYKHRRDQIDAINRAIHDAMRRRGLPARPTAASDPHPLSETDQHRTWAWWALSGGYARSARKHAFTALRQSPLSLASWRVAYCVLRGH